MFKLRTNLLVVAASLALAAPALAAVSGSSHDFSNGWGTGNSWQEPQICKPCHTPHDATGNSGPSTGGNAVTPLWNHSSTTATFTVYTSETLDSTPNDNSGADMHYSTKLCLSCHDGTVAVDSYGGGPASPAESMTSTDYGFIGTDLRAEHPVGITYDAALATADGELYDPGTAPLSGIGTTIASYYLFGNELGCASCHDVHATETDVAWGKMLRNDPDNSTLCLDCHNK